MLIKNPQELPESGRLMALDVGQKTVGIAYSDATRTVANPHYTMPRKKWREDKVHLEALIAEFKVVGMVVGLPLSMNGDYTPQTDACVAYADLVQKELSLPTLLWDERMTTMAAESALFEQRSGRQKRASKKDVKAQVDAVAAALILQSVLDRLSYGGLSMPARRT